MVRERLGTPGIVKGYYVVQMFWFIGCITPSLTMIVKVQTSFKLSFT